MLSSNFDKTAGGQTFDDAIATFCDDFAKRYKLYVRSNKKATLNLLTEVEKLKKHMSASTHKLPLNIVFYERHRRQGGNREVIMVIFGCHCWGDFYFCRFKGLT